MQPPAVGSSGFVDAEVWASYQQFGDGVEAPPQEEGVDEMANNDGLQLLADWQQLIRENNTLLTNPLSAFWRWNHIQAHPERLLGLYITGMMGYTLSLPLRITIFAVCMIKIISTLIAIVISGRWGQLLPELGRRIFIAIGAFGEMLSGAIGIACPPLAYRIDELIQSSTIIHTWYRNHRVPLSVWTVSNNGNDQEGEVFNTDSSGAVHAILTGNYHYFTNRDFVRDMGTEEVKLKDFFPCFAQAKEEVAQFLEDVDAMDSEVLKVIFTFGCLNSLEQGNGLVTQFPDSEAICEAWETVKKAVPDIEEKSLIKLIQYQILLNMDHSIRKEAKRTIEARESQKQRLEEELAKTEDEEQQQKLNAEIRGIARTIRGEEQISFLQEAKRDKLETLMDDYSENKGVQTFAKKMWNFSNSAQNFIYDPRTHGKDKESREALCKLRVNTLIKAAYGQIEKDEGKKSDSKREAD